MVLYDHLCKLRVFVSLCMEFRGLLACGRVLQRAGYPRVPDGYPHFAGGNGRKIYYYKFAGSGAGGTGPNAGG